MIDPYEVLDIDCEATVEEISRAYKAKARLYHPDKGGDPDAFKELVAAYEFLTDAEKRSQYDADIRTTVIPYSPHVISATVALQDLFLGHKCEVTAKVPYFIDRNGMPGGINKCFVCAGIGLMDLSGEYLECLVCGGSGRLISSKLRHRWRTETIPVDIPRFYGFTNGSRIDFEAFHVVLVLQHDSRVTIRQYDVILRIDIPIWGMIHELPLNISAHIDMSIIPDKTGCQGSYTFIGQGLYKNRVERGHLIILPRITYPDNWQAMIAEPPPPETQHEAVFRLKMKYINI